MQCFERKIHVSELQIGMYVSRLDRPWLETRFLFQGFRVSNEQDIQDLREYCNYVFVDPEREMLADEPLQTDAPQSARNVSLKVIRADSGHQAAANDGNVPEDALRRVLKDKDGERARPERYKVTTPIEEEIQVAREVHGKTLDVVSNILDDIRSGKRVSIKSVRQSVSGMISSILRNPDAFLWLTRLKNKDAYAYAHCVDASSLAVAFGRHLGFSRPDLENLAVGTLMFDIGKLQLPDSLLKKPGRLTDKEYALIRRHVEFGVQLVREMKGVNAEILSIVLNHHERHDGSGYPRGVAGSDIPVNGRIAAVVDCYDAITSERAYSKAVSTYDAIRMIYEWRDKDFQADMVEQFIQCIGLYPTGTLVELSTGEVGIVLAQNRVRRLRPKLMLVLDKDKVAYEINPTLDLIMEPVDDAGNQVEIRCPLPPGSYGIDPNDFYL